MPIVKENDVVPVVKEDDAVPVVNQDEALVDPFGDRDDCAQIQYALMDDTDFEHQPSTITVTH